MLKVSFYLAWRYLKGSQQYSNIRTMLIVCFIGIFIATSSLALVTFIMEGFEKMTHATIQGMHADIIMQAHNQHINIDAIKKVIDHEFPEITACTPSDIQQTLFCAAMHNAKPIVAIIKGVDPVYELATNSLTKILIETTGPLPQLLNENKLLIGVKLAKIMKLKLNHEAQLLAPQEDEATTRIIHLNSHPVKVSGIFKTGIEEFYTNLIICSLSLLKKIFPDAGVSTVHINYSNAHEKKLITKLRKRFGLHVYSWKDLYPALVAALALEKYAMIFVLSLMVLIASMSIISLLFMIITAKQNDQAILQTMGLSKKYIMLVFIIIGLILSACASITGLGFAFIIGLLLQHYSIITLPDAYYVSQLPIIMDPKIFIGIFILILLLSLGGGLLTIMQSKKLSISELLKKNV